MKLQNSKHSMLPFETTQIYIIVLCEIKLKIPANALCPFLTDFIKAFFHAAYTENIQLIWDLNRWIKWHCTRCKIKLRNKDKQIGPRSFKWLFIYNGYLLTYFLKSSKKNPLISSLLYYFYKIRVSIHCLSLGQDFDHGVWGEYEWRDYCS